MCTTYLYRSLSHFRYSLTIAFLLFVANTFMAMPRLTIVVMVDGLNQYNLELMRPYWTQGGLQMMSEEAYQNTFSFPHPVYGGDETAASILTGTTPLMNGFAMDKYFLRRDRQLHAMLEDAQYAGIGTDLHLSPRAILSPTITDQVRMKYGEQAKLYAIGIQPTATILLAGHSANACCWIDQPSQRWVTSSFYSEGLPSVADAQNVSNVFENMASVRWQPQMDIPMYNFVSDSEKKNGFSYLVKDYLTQTPMANTLVIRLALQLIEAQKLGADPTPDMLLLQLNTITPATTTDCIRTAEQEDLYLRFNQDLGYLISQVSKHIRREDFDILLVGRPVLGSSPQSFEKANLPIQPFDMDRVTALCSTYLMALYGHERWIDGSYGQSIFLNRTLIEQKRLPLETMQRQLANFLMEFEGVQLAWPQSDILLDNQISSLSKRSLGDVYFTLLPGWQLMLNEKTVIDRVMDIDPVSPVMLWSGSLRHLPEQSLLSTQLMQLIK